MSFTDMRECISYSASTLDTEKLPAYWTLFEHMSHEHGLTLLDSELEDICMVVERMRGWRPAIDAKPKRILCAACGVPVSRVTYGACGPNPKTVWKHAVGKAQGWPKPCKTPTPSPNDKLTDGGHKKL